MATILKNWHFMRLVRAGFAVWIFREVWVTGEWVMLILGVIFAMQAIFDIGCCGAAGCAVPRSDAYKNQSEGSSGQEVIYEEIK